MSNYTAIAISKKTNALLEMETRMRGLSKSKLVEWALEKFFSKEKFVTAGELLNKARKKSGLDKLKMKNKLPYSPITDEDWALAYEDKFNYGRK